MAIKTRDRVPVKTLAAFTLLIAVLFGGGAATVAWANPHGQWTPKLGLDLEGGEVRVFRSATLSKSRTPMPEFMDVHRGRAGVSNEALAQADSRELAIQDDESVSFKHAWADPATGVAFCLSDSPPRGAVRRIP